MPVPSKPPLLPPLPMLEPFSLDTPMRAPSFKRSRTIKSRKSGHKFEPPSLPRPPSPKHVSLGDYPFFWVPPTLPEEETPMVVTAAPTVIASHVDEEEEDDDDYDDDQFIISPSLANLAVRDIKPNHEWYYHFPSASGGLDPPDEDDPDYNAFYEPPNVTPPLRLARRSQVPDPLPLHHRDSIMSGPQTPSPLLAPSLPSERSPSPLGLSLGPEPSHAQAARARQEARTPSPPSTPTQRGWPPTPTLTTPRKPRGLDKEDGDGTKEQLSIIPLSSPAPPAFALGRLPMPPSPRDSLAPPSPHSASSRTLSRASTRRRPASDEPLLSPPIPSPRPFSEPISIQENNGPVPPAPAVEKKKGKKPRPRTEPLPPKPQSDDEAELVPDVPPLPTLKATVGSTPPEPTSEQCPTCHCHRGDATHAANPTCADTPNYQDPPPLQPQKWQRGLLPPSPRSPRFVPSRAAPVPPASRPSSVTPLSPISPTFASHPQPLRQLALSPALFTSAQVSPPRPPRPENVSLPAPEPPRVVAAPIVIKKHGRDGSFSSLTSPPAIVKKHGRNSSVTSLTSPQTPPGVTSKAARLLGVGVEEPKKSRFPLTRRKASNTSSPLPDDDRYHCRGGLALPKEGRRTQPTGWSAKPGFAPRDSDTETSGDDELHRVSSRAESSSSRHKVSHKRNASEDSVRRVPSPEGQLHPFAAPPSRFERFVNRERSAPPITGHKNQASFTSLPSASSSSASLVQPIGISDRPPRGSSLHAIPTVAVESKKRPPPITVPSPEVDLPLIAGEETARVRSSVEIVRSPTSPHGGMPSPRGSVSSPPRPSTAKTSHSRSQSRLSQIQVEGEFSPMHIKVLHSRPPLLSKNIVLPREQREQIERERQQLLRERAAQLRREAQIAKERAEEQSRAQEWESAFEAHEAARRDAREKEFQAQRAERLISRQVERMQKEKEKNREKARDLLLTLRAEKDPVVGGKKVYTLSVATDSTTSFIPYAPPGAGKAPAGFSHSPSALPPSGLPTPAGFSSTYARPGVAYSVPATRNGYTTSEGYITGAVEQLSMTKSREPEIEVSYFEPPTPTSSPAKDVKGFVESGARWIRGVVKRGE